MAVTLAQHLVTQLRDFGVERIYGVVGDSLNPIVDAVRTTKGIDWVHVRNEEAAAFAAGAEARVSGKLAVCAGSCGPGNTHLIQGLYDAHRDGAPVLAIASHIPSGKIGTGFFQETHPERLFQECSHFCEMVNSGQHGADMLHIAAQTALAKQGVSVLVIPGDVADEEVESGATKDLATRFGRVQPDPQTVEELASLVNRANSVTLFAGAGVRGAREQVLALAEAVKAPVGHAFGGKEWIQYDNPYDVGMSGLLGYGACYEAMHEADLVILLGTDFPYSEFLPQKDVTVVQVDADGSRLGRRIPLDLAVNGDVALTIDALLPLVQPKRSRKFLDALLRKHEKALKGVVSAYTRNVEKMKPIHPEFVAATLDELADDDAIFTVDTGMCNVWGARYITPNGKRRVFGSWHHGTMANALPQAIGASAGNPGRQVISMSGDGGLGMLMGELLTVKLHQLDTKIVVFNNSSLGMVKLEMLVEGLPDYETDHEHVDFAAIAAGAGIHSVKITDPKKLKKELGAALKHKGPVLIDVVTDPAALSMPPKVTSQQIRGFAMASTKVVLGGGVGKMLDMAATNVRNIPR
ncbi:MULTISPECIES: pyruvate dehydrogenase [Brachybacterium]|uniref:Pyruvate dehydrogenase n=1 Tax=Brachybacterium halotolerans TaxID=2795215 RepID=A0ABS1BEE0_9MICO|nr:MULTISPECIES: pyruvate dehydrogenase [Brachybacterium]MBK0332485.1 pyruvate dehydrogenase [Brachybacterium halotolerans]MBK0333009.1 pyruvate dehydrogenase [Brachybacterium halotolerans]MCG7309842.1 pyruvate dehydrogenase [Brachybacterium sp. ACRRE]